MIKNMYREDYDGTPNENGFWWTWTETCDRCNELIRDETTQSTKKGDENKLHLCYNCLLYVLNNDIPKEEAYRMFKKKE